jgi:hypothetical protein
MFMNCVDRTENVIGIKIAQTELNFPKPKLGLVKKIKVGLNLAYVPIIRLFLSMSIFLKV